MRILRHSFGVVIALATMGTATGLLAQAPAQRTAPHPTFAVVRFASQAAHVVYSGYGTEALTGFIGLVMNPRSGYHEAILGVATTLAPSTGASALVGVAYADASDARYVQLYINPDVRVGRMLLDGTIEGYVPLGSRGVVQMATAPLNLVVGLTGRVALGASWVGGVQQQGLPSHAIGPSLRVRIPSGRLSVDLLHGAMRAPREVRVTVVVSP